MKHSIRNVEYLFQSEAVFTLIYQGIIHKLRGFLKGWGGGYVQRLSVME